MKAAFPNFFLRMEWSRKCPFQGLKRTRPFQKRIGPFCKTIKSFSLRIRSFEERTRSLGRGKFYRVASPFEGGFKGDVLPNK